MDNFDCDPGFYKIDGITLGSNFTREAVQKATSLEFSSSDVLSATYPKTGKISWIANSQIKITPAEVKGCILMRIINISQK